MMNERISPKRLPESALFIVNDGRSNLNPEGIGFFALVAEDYRSHGRDFFSPGFWALFWHRFGNWRMGIKPRLLRLPFSLCYQFMHLWVRWMAGIELPYTVKVGRRVILEHFGGMVLVAQSIGDDVTIRQNTTFGIARLDDRTGRPVIGNGVELGTGVVILGRIVVGDDAVVGANAVVVKSVPPLAVVGGVPARLLRLRTKDEADRNRLLRLQN
jgi:serine O-acetyltransferase